MAESKTNPIQIKLLTGEALISFSKTESLVCRLLEIEHLAREATGLEKDLITWADLQKEENKQTFALDKLRIVGQTNNHEAALALALIGDCNGVQLSPKMIVGWASSTRKMPICAFLNGHKHVNCTYLFSIYVLKEYQRKKVGTQLMAAIKAHARDKRSRGIHSDLLTVYKEQNTKFHSSLGFSLFNPYPTGSDFPGQLVQWAEHFT